MSIVSEIKKTLDSIEKRPPMFGNLGQVELQYTLLLKLLFDAEDLYHEYSLFRRKNRLRETIYMSEQVDNHNDLITFLIKFRRHLEENFQENS